MQPLSATFAIKDLDEKIEARKALISEDGAIAKKMKVVEALVAACNSPFYCGDSLTLADCHLFMFMGMMRSGKVLITPFVIPLTPPLILCTSSP